MIAKRFCARICFTLGPVFCPVLCLAFLICGPNPALAGETIVWNGAGQPGTTGELRPEPYAPARTSLFPDAPSGNTVTVNGIVPDRVYGGYWQSLSDSAVTSSNTVTIVGGSIGGHVYGGYAMGASGSNSATANGNSVYVRGGDIGGDVYGGQARSDDTAKADGNSVTIAGGSISGHVYGGYASSDSSAATAGGNTVTLTGSPLFTATSVLYGGDALGFVSADAFTGNSLNVWNYTGSSVAEARNFQYLNVILPASLQAFSVTTLTLGDGAGTNSEITGVSIMGGGAIPQSGDVLPLISAATVSGAISNDGAVISGKKGVSLLYDFQLDQTAAGITATVLGDPRVNPQTKAFAEGRVAELAFINQGADLVATTGMRAARNSRSANGPAPFFAAQGGKSRYDSGSHVDVDGFSLLAGLAWNADTYYGALTLGAFFESGWGTYDSHNSFSNYASVNGNGDTGYNGVGVLGRMEFPLGPSVAYAEMSFRGGWAETDFSSGDLRDATGHKADYDSGSAYYGAHVGLGYIWNITETASVDIYTKYFWTRQASDSVAPAGDPVHFKRADSHRWRGGARFAYTVETAGGFVFTPYLGAAYEHEFDGEAEATVYGRAIDKPDLTGGTGMGEVGVSLKPSAASALSCDFGVQGYTGVREGVTGKFQIQWVF
ncbi:MAG: hypothetical protein DELT_01804 [Desulfovibrio sp.]